MNQFKKSFRGYNPEQVDERLRDLETQLKASEARCELLENQLTQARHQADTAQSHLEDYNTEIQKLKDRYEHLRLEQSEKQNQAESIGRVYIKAFESGREIVTAPAPHIEQFLQHIESATKKSGLEISEAKRDFSDTSDKITALIAEIDRQTAFLRHRLEELSTDIESMDNVYMQFDRVKNATKADIDRIRQNYEQIINDYQDPSLYHTPSEKKSTVQTSRSNPVKSEPFLSGGDTSYSKISAPLSDEASDNHTPELVPIPTDNSSISVQPAGTGKIETDRSTGVDERNEVPPMTDTAADFRESSDVLGEDSEPDMTKSSLPQGQNEQNIRGQNILNLLHKYQKK